MANIATGEFAAACSNAGALGVIGAGGIADGRQLAAALALRDGFVPATINYRVPDEACGLDVVPNTGRRADIACAMSNSLGFGGHNVSLVLQKWEA